MRGAVMMAGSRLRRRWRSVVLLGLLIAVAGGLVLTGLAGARRTRTALDRFERETSSSSGGVLLFDGPNRRFAQQVSRLPHVEQSGQLVVWAASIAGSHGETPIVAAADGGFGERVDQSVLVSGRRARGAHEIVVSQNVAHPRGYRVGSKIRLVTYAPDQLDALRGSQSAAATPSAHGPVFTLRVVGIDRRVGDLSTQGERTGILYVGNDVYRTYHDRVLAFAGIVRVRLDDDDLAGFTRRFNTIARGHNTAFDTGGLDVGGVEDSLDVLAAGLFVFAVIGALGTLVTLAIVLARWSASWGRDQPVELALGQESAARVAGIALPLLPGLALGSVGAAVLAAVGSRWMPIGAARAVDTHPGFDIDLAVLGGGMLAITLIGGLLALTTAWWASRRSRWDQGNTGRVPRTRLLAALNRWQIPVPAVLGSRMALDPGRGPNAVAGRTAIVACALGTAGIVAALVVGASLTHLGDQPTRWSYRYDEIVEGGGGLEHPPDDPSCSPVRTALSGVKEIAAIANMCQTSVTIGGATVNAIGLGPVRGTIRPLILRGHAPVGRTDVALGEKTLSRIGRSIGDTVEIAGETGKVRGHIVGTTILPTPNSHDTVTLADGAFMRADTLAKLGAGSFPQLVIRWRSDADIARGRAKVKQITGQRVIAPVRPPEVNRLLQVDDLPGVLAAFLGLLALLGIGHAVVTNATRRRRELALVQTLGLRTRQISETISAHAFTLAGLGVLIGVPIGVVAGRATWAGIAHGVGVAADATIPWRALGVMVLAVIVAVLLVTSIPARRAGRAHPAVALRSE